jgi:hypothetical protein
VLRASHRTGKTCKEKHTHTISQRTDLRSEQTHTQINEQTGSKKRESYIYYYFNVFVDDDEFEQDREVNLKILKCFDNVPFFVVVGNCLGDIEQDDAPSTDEDGEEFG